MEINVKANLELTSSELLTLAEAREKKLKMSAAVQLLGHIATVCGIEKCLSLYEGRPYISEAVCIQINSKI